MEIKLISETINNHYNWFPNSNNLFVLYYDAFKYKVEFNESFFLHIQKAFLNRVPNKITNCYIFLAIDYNKTKIADYYKVWKKVQNKFDMSGFILLQEKIINDYFVGLARFLPTDLKTAMAIQSYYLNRCFILMDVDNSENQLEVQTLASEFLKKNSNEGFENLILKYCKKGMYVCRVGDGGEDWEIAFIFQKEDNGNGRK